MTGGFKRKLAAWVLGLLVGSLLAGAIGTVPGLAADTAMAEGDGKRARSEEAWRFAKPITLGGTGRYHRFVLDEEVYAGSRADLADLRIADRDGRLVPYYVDSVWTDETDTAATYASRLLHTAVKEQDTMADYRLTAPAANQDIRVNRIAFALPEQTFLKHVEVLGSLDGINWTEVAAGDLYRTDNLEQGFIAWDTPRRYDHYRIVVKNNVERFDFGQPHFQFHEREAEPHRLERELAADYGTQQEGSQTILTVENRDRWPVVAVRVEAEGSFVRHYTAHGEAGNRLPLTGSAMLHRLADGQGTKADTTISFAKPVRDGVLVFRIDNEDNPPLFFTDVTLVAAMDRVVFEDDGRGPYRLLFGDEEAAMPRYDLAYFKSHIEAEGPVDGELGPLVILQEANEPTWWSTAGKGVFRVVVVVVALAMIAIVLTVLRKSEKP